MKKLDTSNCSLAYLSVILLLHYLVKCRSRILAVYNNEFVLGSACVGSEMIHRIATNRSNSYYLSESFYVLHHIIFIFAFSQNVFLQHERKRVDVDATHQQHL